MKLPVWFRCRWGLQRELNTAERVIRELLPYKRLYEAEVAARLAAHTEIKKLRLEAAELRIENVALLNGRMSA